MDLHAGSASQSLKKKGNKSKLNRLRRIGPVSLAVVGEAGLETALGEIIAQYDPRQLRTAGYEPFSSDPRKRPFHVEMGRRGLLHVSFLEAGDRKAAGHVGVRSGEEVILAIVSFDPDLAEHSPNKLLLLMLAEKLAGEGFCRLDLTPGGDEWKDRLATRFERVHELRLFRSAWARTLEASRKRAVEGFKHLDHRMFGGAITRMRRNVILSSPARERSSAPADGP